MPDKASLNFDQLISAASARHGVPEHLVRGVIQQESGGDPLAVSKKGARGLMQLLPSTAADMGVQDEFDPAQNIDGGTKYLGQLLKRFVEAVRRRSKQGARGLQFRDGQRRTGRGLAGRNQGVRR